MASSGSAATTGWTVRFRFANQVVGQSWSANLAQSGLDVTATNMSWNGALAPAASTTFGFIASWTATNPLPVPTCTAT